MEEIVIVELEYQIEVSIYLGGISIIIEEEEEESSVKDSESKLVEEKVISVFLLDKVEFKVFVFVSSVVIYYIGICSVIVYICNFFVIKFFIINFRQKMVIIIYGEQIQENRNFFGEVCKLFL